MQPKGITNSHSQILDQSDSIKNKTPPEMQKLNLVTQTNESPTVVHADKTIEVEYLDTPMH